MRSFYQKAAVVLSVAALLTGCAKEGEVQDTEKKQEDTVLTILVQQSGTNMSGTWEGESADRLYEETGIRLEFYSNGNGDEKRLKQYLAAGTLPDIIGFRDMEQAELLTGAGVLADLDEWEEELSDVFETSGYETALRYYRENFGGEEEDLYFLPTSVGKQGAEKDYWMPMVQWNAYEKAGCPQVEHLEIKKCSSLLLYMGITGWMWGRFRRCLQWMQRPEPFRGFWKRTVSTNRRFIFILKPTRENFWIRIREPRLLRNCRKSIRKDRFYFPVMRGRPESMEGQKQKRKNKATDISLL